MTNDRYDVIGNEWLFEPGSNDQVLKNKLRIIDPAKMEEVEYANLLRASKTFEEKFAINHQFKSADLIYMHKEWLGPIYEAAGKYREVNISKDGFTFASAQQIPLLMKELEDKYLSKYSPLTPRSNIDIAEALAVTHVELILIHPFREGNGRTARELSTLMAYQSGLPALSYDSMMGDQKQNYISAIHSGFSGDMKPMKDIFIKAIEYSISKSNLNSLESLKWHSINQNEILEFVTEGKLKAHVKDVINRVEEVTNRSSLSHIEKIKVCSFFEKKESLKILCNDRVSPNLKVAVAWVSQGGDIERFPGLNKNEIQLVESLNISKQLDRGRDF